MFVRGDIVYSATVYNILRRRGLNRKIGRLLALEDMPSKVKISPVLQRNLNEARAALPGIKSYHTGYMFSADTFYACRLKSIGRIY